MTLSEFVSVQVALVCKTFIANMATESECTSIGSLDSKLMTAQVVVSVELVLTSTSNTIGVTIESSIFLRICPETLLSCGLLVDNRLRSSCDDKFWKPRCIACGPYYGNLSHVTLVTPVT